MNIPHAGPIDEELSMTETDTSDELDPEPDGSGAFRFDPTGVL